jgi:hypothetical protein
MLSVSQDLAGGGTGDSDGDGVLDGLERWYFGDLSHNGSSDDDGDGLTLLQEFQAGSDPTAADTDGDGFNDGTDPFIQNRLGVPLQRVRGRLRFGRTPGTDSLILRLELAGPGTELDPTVQPITLTLRDDDEIYRVTLPVNDPNDETERPWKAGASGRTFRYQDRTGAVNGITRVRYMRARRNSPTRLEFRTRRGVDLSNAEATSHDITTAVSFSAQITEGANALSTTSPWRVIGLRGNSLATP